MYNLYESIWNQFLYNTYYSYMYVVHVWCHASNKGYHNVVVIIIVIVIVIIIVIIIIGISNFHVD